MTTDPTNPNPFAAALTPPAPDTVSAETLAAIRASHNPLDPKSIYFGRPDLATAAEGRVREFMQARGLVEPTPPSREALAEQRLSQQFPSINERVPSGLAEILGNELDRLAALGKDELARRTEQVREELGPAAHDALLARARSALGAGVPWRPEMAASLHYLRVMGGVAAYRDHHAAARARITK